MPIVPTVKIKRPHESGDYALVNEADFDPDEHERYEADDKAEADEPEEVAKAPQGEPEYLGGGYYRVGDDKIQGKGAAYEAAGLPLPE